MTVSSRLMTFSRETVSNSNFCLERKIPTGQKVKIWGNLSQYFSSFLLGLVSRLVLWLFVSRPNRRDCLVSSCDLAVSISSRLVTFVSLPALGETFPFSHSLANYGHNPALLPPSCKYASALIKKNFGHDSVGLGLVLSFSLSPKHGFTVQDRSQ